MVFFRKNLYNFKNFCEHFKIQVYIRSVADNIQSEAEQVKVVCGEPVSTGKMCLAKAPKATNVDLGRNNVEINLG